MIYIRTIPLIIFFFCAAATQSWAQICSISHFPYGWSNVNRPEMNGDLFKATTIDIDFKNTETRSQRPYSEYWVEADVLNIRSAPSVSAPILQQTYKGAHYFAFAKKGDWVAISKPITNSDTKWVHQNYLSARRLQELVSSKILEQRCGFINLAKNYDIIRTDFKCLSVHQYLSRQALYSKPHPYQKDFNDWVKNQSDPRISKIGC